MKNFDDLINAVVDDGLTESAVVSNYFLVNYPYLQGIEPEERAGEEARANLRARFNEVPYREIRKKQS